MPTDAPGPADVDLGPFRVTSPIARGAMGEVWRAWHRDQRLAVALKVLTGNRARDERYVAHFHNEVRAVASLDHPHIVTLLDAGTIDEEAEARSGGRLVAGSPWLAMEYASGGTLKQHPPTRWKDIREVLMATLAALAHAHARGVVHRDLKPANLLWCRERDPRPGLKLSDFGIAARFGQEDLAEPGAGTPHYMAPEQLTDGELGPWTDLYALGVLAWKLTTGRLPFEGLKKLQLIRAHLGRALPPWYPPPDVPRGVERWLHALLGKRPQDRPQRAADAAAALVALDPDADDEASRAWMGMAGDELGALELATDDLETADADTTSGHGPSRTIGPPPRVPEWRETHQQRPPDLLGAGLGLYGLREPPLVGRTAEQDLLWEELRGVHEDRRPRLVVLRGAAGCGKTRLGSWLCLRSDELGAARVLWSEGRAGSSGGLVRTLGRMLRCEGLSLREREQHLLAVLHDPERARTTAALLDGQLSEASRIEVAARLLADGATDRPVVLCLDQAQRSEEDLDVCAALLERPTAVLVVLLVEDEELAARPRAATRLAELAGLTVPLGPLDASATRALVQGLLRLDDDLAIQVEARSEGNPMYAVQMIGDWVHRGWLVPGERGFRLQDDVRGALVFPDELHTVWTHRIDRLSADLPPSATWDLEVAAALGPDVDERAWHTACDDPEQRGLGWDREGLLRRAELRRRLCDRHLATPTSHGFCLLPQPRQSVIRASQERGRWARVCAAAARALHAEGRGSTTARVGHLLVEAGQPLDGLPLLLDAIAELRHGSARDALSLLVEAEEAARRVSLGVDSPLACRLRIARATVHLGLGEPDEALRHAHAAVGSAVPRLIPGRPVPPWAPLAREALDVELAVHLGRRDVGAAHRAFERLAPLVRATGDPEAMGRLLDAQAGLLLGDPSARPAADALLVEAAEWFRQAGSGVEATAASTLNRAVLARESGRVERAQALLESVLDELGSRGSRPLVARALTALAEVHLRKGEVSRAEQLARRAVSVYEALGNPGPDARLVLGLAVSAAGRHDLAVTELERARRTAAEHGRTELLRNAHLAAALAEARSGRFGAVHDRLRDAERAPPPRDTWTAELARELATVCDRAGFPQLRARATALVG